MESKHGECFTDRENHFGLGRTYSDEEVGFNRKGSKKRKKKFFVFWFLPGGVVNMKGKNGGVWWEIVRKRKKKKFLFLILVRNGRRAGPKTIFGQEAKIRDREKFVGLGNYFDRGSYFDGKEDKGRKRSVKGERKTKFCSVKVCWGLFWFFRGRPREFDKSLSIYKKDFTWKNIWLVLGS